MPNQMTNADISLILTCDVTYVDLNILFSDFALLLFLLYKNVIFLYFQRYSLFTICLFLEANFHA